MASQPFYVALLLFFLVAVAQAAETLPADQPPPQSDEENCPEACGYNAKCTFGLSGWACVCNSGYEGDGLSCTDIDECSADPSPCDRNAYCENTEGGYLCTCNSGYEGDGHTCIQATKGVFPAVVKKEDYVEPDDDGREGLFLELHGGDVIEINQLQATQYVDPGWAVKKKGGGFVEAEVFYDIPAEMNAGEVGTFTITYNAVDDQGNRAETRERTVRVLDVDECEQNLHTCSVHAKCVNTDGGYVCECKEGFTGDGFKCSDVNECKTGAAECHSKADCTNTIGSYVCTCKEGYEGDGRSCENIDECKNPVLNKCDPNAECTDTEGSFECKCRDGFQGTGFVCEPVDSCTHQRHDCHPSATCHTANNEEGFICICKTGFVGDGKQCTDLDECQDPERYTCSEHSTCVNQEGGYECVCDPGFEKADDGYTCVDVDECVREVDDCSPHANCTNTEGAFECVCKEGYTGDGKKCVLVSTPPDIVLRGSNPLVMHACDPYREEGFTVSDAKQANLRVSVAVPPALMESPVMQLGTFQIRYIVTDQQEHRSVQLRNVTVERVDPCELPEGHRCRHKCHPWAKCVSSDVNPFYTCVCNEGYATSSDEEGNPMCTDNYPPTIMLVGPEVVTLRACRVCNWFDRGENYDERKHGGFHAFDTLPDGRKINLDPYVTITNETIIPDKEWKIYYDVKDAAGNPAPTRVRVVKKEVEDILRRIETIEKFLNQKFAEFEPYEKQIDFLTTYSLLLLRILGVAVGLVLVIYLVPRLINMLRVMFVQDTPTFEEYSDAYDLWFALTRPWVRTSERARMVQIQYQRQFRDK